MAMHTDIPSSADIERLSVVLSEPAVSIYLSTSPESTDNDAARIELKNAVGAATSQLAEAGAHHSQITAITELADGLRTDAAFWRHQSHSLAVFLTPSEVRTFRLPSRLSAATEVSDRFHIKPLLRALTFGHVAFVLALSQNSVRLVEIAPDSPAFEVGVNELPRDLESELGPFDDNNRGSFARMGSGDTERALLGQFARAVDRVLRPVLSGRSVPLILAATEPLAAIFRSVTNYAHLADQGIDGNTDELTDTDLAAAARAILDDLYAAEIDAVRKRLTEDAPRERVAFDLQQVARAATFGAIEVLLVDIDSHQPGFLDEHTGELTLTEEADAADYGVGDEIARRALRTGARVLAVRAEDIPEQGPVAALLRFGV